MFLVLQTTTKKVLLFAKPITIILYRFRPVEIINHCWLNNHRGQKSPLNTPQKINYFNCAAGDIILVFLISPFCIQ